MMVRERRSLTQDERNLIVHALREYCGFLDEHYGLPEEMDAVEAMADFLERCLDVSIEQKCEEARAP
jgi:hypothetical protein